MWKLMKQIELFLISLLFPFWLFLLPRSVGMTTVVVIPYLSICMLFVVLLLK